MKFNSGWTRKIPTWFDALIDWLNSMPAYQKYYDPRSAFQSNYCQFCCMLLFSNQSANIKRFEVPNRMNNKKKKKPQTHLYRLGYFVATSYPAINNFPFKYHKCHIIPQSSSIASLRPHRSTQCNNINSNLQRCNDFPFRKKNLFRHCSGKLYTCWVSGNGTYWDRTGATRCEWALLS